MTTEQILEALNKMLTTLQGYADPNSWICTCETEGGGDHAGFGCNKNVYVDSAEEPGWIDAQKALTSIQQ